MFAHGDYVAGRGTVVGTFGTVYVFSRIDSRGTRVFDAVDYTENEHGAQIATFYGVKEAKSYASEYGR